MEWLLPVSLLMTTVATGGYHRLRRRPAKASTYRTCFLSGLGVAAPIWLWLHANGRVSLSGSLFAVAAGFAGGVGLTTTATGLVEDNARPSPATRQKVLDHHRSADFKPLPEPPFKRTFDIAAASLGLVVTLPLWPFIAFVIWIEEPGPIFFTKNSVGRGGVTFRQLKFRSMTYDAERFTGPLQSIAGDPRTLRCGRFLRRYHLDELPELVNVLTGTMSMVGPRPLRTVLVEQHLAEVPGFAERHRVKPGIACIAQIEKSRMTGAERLRKDLEYIRRMSVRLDAKLLWRAVVTTVRGTRDRHRRQG
jgi:lipopolysaccharide/colanic/teichoic acid biosynthesis glycosyltransferase